MKSENWRNWLLGATVGITLTAIGAPVLVAQTASLLPNAVQYFMDGNGKPLANGKVFFYEPGGTTPKTTWTTAGETVPQANPVVLGSSGRPPNPIYGDGSYRQVVKDQFNNVIWDFNTASTGSSSGGGGTSIGDGLAVGTILAWPGTTLPTNYLYLAGQAVSRTTYPQLLTALTSQVNIVCSIGIATISVPVAVSEITPIGASVEASCFAPGTTVIATASGQLTLSSNATVSVSVAAVVFPWQNGDGATTFILPDMRGRVAPGRDNMNSSVAGRLSTALYSVSGLVNPDSINAAGGNQVNALATPNLPPYTPAGTITNGAITTTTVQRGGTTVNNAAPAGGPNFLVDAGVIPIVSTQAVSTFAGTAQGGTSLAFRTVQPSVTTDYIIKALPDVNISVASCLQLADAGTACQASTGTSGHKVPFLDGNNTWSGTNDFGTVTITGGTITGMPAPTIGADVANKSYVDSVATGLHILAASNLTTTTVLPNSPTYANGAAGVGATLTAGSNSTLTVDGTVAGLNAVVLVKNQASTFQNGIYTVTTAGSGAAPWVLTRATYFDQAAEMLGGSYTLVTSGATLFNTSYVLQSSVPTVGTDPVVFVLFANGVTPPGGSNGQVQFNNGGVFGGLTNTQLTADVNAFTSSLSGAVPASGGGVTTFLRADGTFASPAYGSSVHLNNINEAWIPPNPNRYHLFIANALRYNQNSLFASCCGSVGAAWVPPNGTSLVHMTAQIWATSGVAATGSFVVKWIKNGTVDGNNNLNVGVGSDICTGIGNISDAGSGTAIMRADCDDAPSPGDYYNLYMFIDSTSLGATTIQIDSNPAHTFVQFSVLN